MADLGRGASFKRKRELAERIFTPLHPGEVFVAAFRGLLSVPEYGQVIRSDARRMEEAAEERTLPLRKSTPYKEALAEFRSLLHPQTPSLTRITGLLVSDQGLAASRDAFRDCLLQAAGAYNEVAVVLALMDALEQQLGSALITEFRSRRSPHSARCSPVEPKNVIPRSPAAFGTDIVQPSKFLPPIGLLDEEVFLADSFGRVTATPHLDGYNPAPALHVYSSSGRASLEATTWRVAMLSILANVEDVNWQPANGLFRGSALRNPRVRTRLAWALEHCDAFAPDVIVIPELNMDTELTTMLQSWLRREPRGSDAVSPLVVYGALHTPCPGRAVGYRNKPGLLTPAREIEWDYWKVNPVFNPANGTYENLGVGPQHVVGVDLPIGRVAVLICKDFLTDAVRRAVEQLRPTLLIVPAMTTPGSVERFRNHAHNFASSLRCVTLFCNSSILLRAELSAGSLRSDGGTLGVVQVNTRVRNGPASHPLGLMPSTAVLGLYSLVTSEKGLDVTFSVERLTPEQEDARAL